MNHRSDIDRVLQVWMTDGPTAIPDRVVDVVAARIVVQRQRRTWPFQGRTTVTNPMKLIAALAAALVVAVVGYNLLPRQPSGAGGSPQPTVTQVPATATPVPATAEPSATSRLTFRPLESAPELTVTFELPAGWENFEDWVVTPPSGSRDPSGIAVLFDEADGIHSDPCRWDSAENQRDTQPGDLASDGDALGLATALQTNPAYTSTGSPTPVSLGSLDGHAVEIELPDDLDFATCDRPQGDQDGQYVVLGGPAGGFYPQGPANRWRLHVVDVADTQLAVVLSSFADTPAADMAAAESIIASIEITP